MLVQEKEKVQLTDRQQEIVNFNGDQMLVKGIAGSGKTLVLIQKACKIAKENPNESVAIFSFGKPLSDAAAGLVAKTGLKNLQVITFHSWAYKGYMSTFNKKPNYAKPYDTKKYFKEAMNVLKLSYPTHRFFKDKDFEQFVKEEISFIKGAEYDTSAKYLDKEARKGRGGKIRLSMSDRELLYKIYETYEKNKGNELDYDDSAVILAKNLKKIPDSVKFDHVFIDEAQDLTKAALKVLVEIGRKTCNIGADIGQKIYATTFTWKDVGLNLRGNRVKTLQKSFRSTKQIVMLAQSLQKNDEISKNEEFTQHVVPDKEGAVPTAVLCGNQAIQDKAIVAAAEKFLQTSEKANVGILCRNWETATRLQELMNRENIAYTEIGDNKDFKRKHKATKGTHLEPGIQFTTFHTAKGLEFYYVIVADLVNPSLEERLGDEFDWDLERRLLYVAMTRAKIQLQLYTYDKNVKLLNELDEELYEVTVLN